MPLQQTSGNATRDAYGGSASAAVNYIENFFSTYLYNGNSGAQTINNGIALTNTAAWSMSLLGTDSVYTDCYGVATDSSGNVYTAGNTGTPGSYVTLVSKYDSGGTLQWQRTISLGSIDFLYGVAVDSSGNVYASGYAPVGSKNYFYIVKYNSSGTLQWQRTLGDPSPNSESYGIALDTSANIYVVGNSAGSGFIAKYNSSGSLQWQEFYGSGTYMTGVATDSSGNVYIAGYGGSGSGVYSILAKLNSSGVLQWDQKLTGASYSTYGVAVSVDGSGNPYLMGITTPTGGDTALIAKYNSSGTLQWQRYLSSGQALAGSFDSSNNLYVTGFTPYNGNNTPYLAKYNSSGSLQWNLMLIGSTAAIARGVSADSSGNVYIAGEAIAGFTGSYYSQFIAKLQQDGSADSGTTYYNLVPSVQTDSAGSLTAASAGFSVSSGYLTDAAGTGTDSAGTLTPLSSTQAAVSSDGGMVWIKARSNALRHAIADTVQGRSYYLVPDTTFAAQGPSPANDDITSFNSNGFSLGQSDYANVNSNAVTFASWTFRKQPKFFDVVTYTGNTNGTSDQVISHNLGSVPGMMIIKKASGASPWYVWHRSLASDKYLQLQSTGGQFNIGATWPAPTSTEFTAYQGLNLNDNGSTYVAYLFAHNAGGFGLTGTDNVISCGSFTADGSGNATVTLGYEPQWLLVKRTSSGEDWWTFDSMRGLTVGSSGDALLRPNTSDAEANLGDIFSPTATGFTSTISGAPSESYIYIAIRRGPMKTPTSGTSVFSVGTRAGSASVAKTNSSVLTDLAVIKRYTSAAEYWAWTPRLVGNLTLQSNSTDAELTGAMSTNPWDTMTGAFCAASNGATNTSTLVDYSFQRAPGFFDVVCYTGTGSATTQTHNLGVVPEMMIIKRRDAAESWAVYSASEGNTKYLTLNSTAAVATGTDYWNSTTPTSSQFTVGLDLTAGGSTYVAYLFASCPGVSKVGSYTGTGATQTISCGFAARFVLIKRTDSTGDWFVWDTARGMVAGTDPRLALNSTAAETNANWVYTNASGFQIVTTDATVNASGGSYIFFAVA